MILFYKDGHIVLSFRNDTHLVKILNKEENKHASFIGELGSPAVYYTHISAFQD